MSRSSGSSDLRPAEGGAGSAVKPSGLRIRPAEEHDIPELLALIGELARYERLEAECCTSAEGLRESLFGGRPVAEALIAEWRGAPVAMAIFFHGLSTFVGRPTLYLEDLFVRPPYRRLGVARALLVRLAQTALERGCCRFEWSVLDWNEPAHAFYRSLGAEPLEEWTIWRVSGTALDALAAGRASGAGCVGAGGGYTA